MVCCQATELDPTHALGCLHHTVQCSSQLLGSSQTTEWCRYSLWCSYRISETVPGHLAAWTHCAGWNLTPCAVSFHFFLSKVMNIFLVLEPLRTRLLFLPGSARCSTPCLFAEVFTFTRAALVLYLPVNTLHNDWIAFIFVITEHWCTLLLRSRMYGFCLLS